MRNFKVFIIACMVFQSLLIPHLSAKATMGKSYVMELPDGGGGSFSEWAVIPYGILMGGSLIYSAISNKTGGMPGGSIWNVISKFPAKKAIDNDELKKLPLATNFIEPDKEINVSFVTREEKNFLIEGYNIKNKVLHLHYIEIPEELLESKQKLVADMTLIYKDPNKEQLDFELLKDGNIKKLEKVIKEKSSEKLITEREDNTVYVLQKEIKISSPQKPYALAVYVPPAEEGTEENAPCSYVNYVALIKVRPLSD